MNMRRYLSTLYMFVAVSCLLSAQIGIQTESPVHTLHIDAARNNNNAAPVTDAQKLDDVVITENGNMGLGLINPTNKLEINGSIKIVDGTQGTGKILASDDNGIASWVPASNFTQTNKYSEWSIRQRASDPGSPSYNFTNSADGDDLTGLSEILSGTANEIGLTPISNYGVQVPSGKFLVLLNGDVESRSEYCQLQVIAQDFGGTPGNDEIMYRSYYSEWLGGATFILRLDQPTVIKLRWFDWPTTGVNYYAHAPYTAHYWYTLSFIQLSN